ncbi:MAG TPA: ribulose-phosphate 3-epimerase [Candidatus Marinimicrobia bacterium]|nr:ribulose-phosphate 3-epimerase [Candidatus Neomarinimicrobiota bacterium]HRS50826.1 ribulose-phosphate 3-epimerase [Candidatus Neomarinimicrobiota bacterium]HRU91833.1 ribulose-phosphate 3-epimerase [Candidatus Neomarinimicrobiota bacterium]
MNHKKPIPEVVPSLLSADFARLKDNIRLVEKAGARRLHLDIMDGHFVPNITIGPLVVEAIRRVTNLHLETHLMIEKPERFIKQFIEAGSNTVILHVESAQNLRNDLSEVRELGAKAGLVLNPPTSFDAVEPYLDEIDHLLIMTVNPGFGGQQIIPETLEKVRRAQTWQARYGFLIEVDGGINRETITEAAAAGADLLVAGYAIFGSGRPGHAFRSLTWQIK